MKRKKLMKKTVAVSVSAAMLLGASSSLVSAEEAKWSEAETPDGWIMVTNEGGDTLGYSPDSGVAIIEQGGLAFKDLDKDGELDVYEDWREDDETRAVDLVSQLSPEEIFPLMFHASLQAFGSSLGENDMANMDAGLRAGISRSSTSDFEMAAKWTNLIESYVEGLDWGIPFTISADSLSVADVPSNLALASTFDAELVEMAWAEISRQYRAIGISTSLGPQFDLATEPRWSRLSSTFGEDPALSRDLARAAIGGTQSTYDEEGNDLGWGTDSVIAIGKHYPSDGAGESGREAHSDAGKYNVYPGGSFTAHLIPFFDGALNLDTATEQAAGFMPSYSIAYTEDESLGELVGSGFSKFKLGLLRDNGYDGLIVSDFGILQDGGKDYGVEDLSVEERICLALEAGVDQFGGSFDVEMLSSAYELLKEDIGEEAALQRIQDSARRFIKTLMEAELFENPYLSVEETLAVTADEEAYAFGKEAQLKSVIMLKNEDNTIHQAQEAEEKPTVYIPLVYTGERISPVYPYTYTWKMPVDLETVSQYYNVITDTAADPTGEPDEDGNATYTENDVVRATPEELAECDYAIVFVTNPMTSGYDSETETYLPISLQYGEYIADSDSVRQESIAGNVVVEEILNPYGSTTAETKENRSYYGQTAEKASNSSNLSTILYARENIPEDAKLIVSINASNPMVVGEFESEADAILLNFGISDERGNTVYNDNVMEIIVGNVEPSGLLPMQMPANMEAVEAQMEDTPRDMECYVDSAGNTYDFAYGLNWSGVISDERTAAYAVEPLTAPESITVE